MINSRTKGKVGELEFAALLRELGYVARRGQQFSGGGDSPDVVHDVEGIHFEIKRTEKLSLWDAMEQATKDAALGNVPVVAHRKNRKDWVVVMDARKFLTCFRRMT